MGEGSVIPSLGPMPPQVTAPKPILSTEGQQRYAMMQEINQTIATLVTQRITTPESDLAISLGSIAARLAQQIDRELGGAL